MEAAAASTDLTWSLGHAVARRGGLGDKAAAGANRRAAMSGPARSDSPRTLLAAGRETDVQAPSMAPVARSRAAISMHAWPRHESCPEAGDDGCGRILQRQF